MKTKLILAAVAAALGLCCQTQGQTSFTLTNIYPPYDWPRSASKTPYRFDFFGYNVLTNNNHNFVPDLSVQYLYDFTTNWTTTNATEKQTLLRTNIYTVSGPYPKDFDVTLAVYYCHTETQLIYSIERVEQQSGTVSSNVFVTLDFNGQHKRVSLESTPIPWPATQTVTNHSETKPTSSFGGFSTYP